MKLHEKIDAQLENHLAGLIRGWELKDSEITHWVKLLLMAEDHKTPIKYARFLGFSFISKKADIPAAIKYLACGK